MPKSVSRTSPRTAACFWALLFFAIVCCFSRAAPAHAPTFAVYSKYEATTSGRAIAFVLALDKAAVLRLFERDVTGGAPIEPGALEQYKTFFSTYVFERLSIVNDGVTCSHPDQLG